MAVRTPNYPRCIQSYPPCILWFNSCDQNFTLAWLNKACREKKQIGREKKKKEEGRKQKENTVFLASPFVLEKLDSCGSRGTISRGTISRSRPQNQGGTSMHPCRCREGVQFFFRSYVSKQSHAWKKHHLKRSSSGDKAIDYFAQKAKWILNREKQGFLISFSIWFFPMYWEKQS